jgi:Cu2+-containing amine oxidase
MTTRCHRPVAAIPLLVSILPVALLAQRPRPLDPLTPEETQIAVRVARADSSVRQLLGGGRSVLGAVYFLATKPEVDSARAAEIRDPRPQRTAVVMFYVYEGNYGVRALVELPQARISRVDRVQEEPIPMAPEEVAEARRLALADPALRDRLGRAERYRIEWLGVTAVDDRDRCYRHRCLQLLFRAREGYLTRPVVIVDLTAQQVRLEEP